MHCWPLFTFEIGNTGKERKQARPKVEIKGWEEREKPKVKGQDKAQKIKPAWKHHREINLVEKRP